MPVVGGIVCSRRDNKTPYKSCETAEELEAFEREGFTVVAFVRQKDALAQLEAVNAKLEQETIVAEAETTALKQLEAAKATIEKLKQEAIAAEVETATLRLNKHSMELRVKNMQAMCMSYQNEHAALVVAAKQAASKAFFETPAQAPNPV